MSNLKKWFLYRLTKFFNIFLFTYILASCAATPLPNYETVYEPFFGEANDEVIEAAEDLCNDRAVIDGQNAARRTMDRFQEDIGMASEGVRARVSRQLRVAFDRAWEEAMNACMVEYGFREIRVCTANCPEELPENS